MSAKYQQRPFREYSPHPLDRSSESQQALDDIRARFIGRDYESLNRRRPRNLRPVVGITAALWLAIAAVAYLATR